MLGEFNGKIDNEGRIRTANETRDVLRQYSGKEVSIKLVEDEEFSGSKITRKEFIENTAGCITEETAMSDAKDPDPLNPMDS